MATESVDILPTKTFVCKRRARPGDRSNQVYSINYLKYIQYTEWRKKTRFNRIHSAQMLFPGQNFTERIFQEDNDPKHTSKSLKHIQEVNQEPTKCGGQRSLWTFILSISLGYIQQRSGG